jgi:phage-related holin
VCCQISATYEIDRYTRYTAFIVYEEVHVYIQDQCSCSMLLLVHCFLHIVMTSWVAAQRYESLQQQEYLIDLFKTVIPILMSIISSVDELLHSKTSIPSIASVHSLCAIMSGLLSDVSLSVGVAVAHTLT